MVDLVANVTVVGAGPAGLSAAHAAAEGGARVLVLDENPRAGGQIWRASHATGVAPEAARLAERCTQAGVRIVHGATVFDAPSTRELTWLEGGETRKVHTDRVVVATGSNERFLPFPGWTLPGVCGAGGLQALVKSGLQVRSARIVVAGSGPLLLAVAAFLKSHGAQVVALVEQAPREAILRLGLSLASAPRKLRQALKLQAALTGIPRSFGAWPLRAEGDGRLERVVLREASGQRTLEVDWLACGFGLTPSTQLAALLGCNLCGDRIEADEFLRTSEHGVHAAGEPLGIGGVECALVEGQMAGHVAAGREDRARALFARRRRERRFAARLERTFALRPELQSLPQPDTLVCRCEDVSWSALQGFKDPRSAKLMTRCGMGPCQGRVCGPALEFLEGWPRDSVRPPLVPVPMGAFGSSDGPSSRAEETTT